VTTDTDYTNWGELERICGIKSSSFSFLSSSSIILGKIEDENEDEDEEGIDK